MRKTIGIDLDDVCNNLVDVWIEKYNIVAKDNLKPSDIHSWDIENYVKPEFKSHMFELLGEPDFFYNLGTQPLVSSITYWLSQHYDLYIVTAYHYKTCADKTKWVKKHLPDINPKNIIFCNNKSLIGTDYLIDDGGHNIEGFKGVPIVFDKPWNRNLDNKYFRSKGWLDNHKFFRKELEKDGIFE